MKSKIAAGIFSLLLLISLVTAPAGLAVHAQTAQAQSADYSSALSDIESKIEARRKELGIPGMSLVIVKDDKVIYLKGLGYKNFEKQVAVSPDTQFPIGSATKAFTALSVLMAADQGKLSLDDSPKKFLPYFKMYDAEADKGITIRDLLSHSSGLNRTDLAMITGKLNRAELIQVAAQARPAAKFREKFLYQNIMYTAAGEIVSVVQKEQWEKWVPKNILAPLGMTNSTMLIREMVTAKDHSLGYDYNFDTKVTRQLPFREIAEVAPAGSINSSARDMGEWLRFVLNGGVVNGKRLVSEASFAEWIKPQMKRDASGRLSYGLGWFIESWKGKKVVQHGGNIDGFNSLVAMLPDEKLGFVMLTNVSGSSLGQDIMPMIFGALTPKAPGQPAPAGNLTEAGKYRLEAAGIDIDVKMIDGKLTAYVPGQPAYPLEKVSGEKYKLVGAPEGFFITFKGREIQLDQPNGSYTLERVEAAPTAATDFKNARELIGEYISPRGGKVEIKEDAEGRVTLVLSGQSPFPLVEKSKDNYSLPPLPEGIALTAKRDAAGKAVSFVLTQPDGEFEFRRADAVQRPAITVEELNRKVVDAMGGEANWKKLTSRKTVSELNLESQGVQGKSIAWAKAPNKTATESTFVALGKTIGTGWEYFDGKEGEQSLSFMTSDKYSGKLLDDIRNSSDFYSILNWKDKYAKIEIVGLGKVDGEDAYIVSFEPKAGTKFSEFYSTNSFLLLRREGVLPSSTGGPTIPYTITYSDYREVDGVKIPFKLVSYNVGSGTSVYSVKSVEHNVPIEDGIFRSKDLYRP